MVDLKKVKKGDFLVWDVGEHGGWQIIKIFKVYSDALDVINIANMSVEKEWSFFDPSKKHIQKYDEQLALIQNGEVITKHDILQKIFDYNYKIYHPANLRR